MFSLNKESLNLANVNLRKEIHGEEKVLAVDLKLELETSNAVLLKFSPTLRDALYTQDPGATQDLINPDHAPTLRNPQMGEIKWALEMSFVRFSVFADGTNEEEIVFQGAKCNSFRFNCKEGGTTMVTFRIQKSEPLELDVTKLVFLMGKSIKVSLEAEDEPEDYSGPDPKPGNVSDMFSESDDGGDGQQDDGAGGDPGLLTESQQADADEAVYAKAAGFVKGLNRASVSMLKRELKVTALVANRLLEQLEANGIIGPADTKGLHDVLETTN
jgi:hypothetical protein